MATPTKQQLTFTPPGPGSWELDPVHFPRPVTAYWAEMHPEPFGLGYGDFLAFYGVPLKTRVTAYPNGFCYGQMQPVTPEEFPARVQRAAEVFEGKLWPDQATEWEEVRTPAAVQAHREIQSIDPDQLSDEDLVAYLRRCREHHALMIRQHMARFVPPRTAARSTNRSPPNCGNRCVWATSNCRRCQRWQTSANGCTARAAT